MSKRLSFVPALLSAAAAAFLGSAVMAADESARLETYGKPGDAGYFALSVSPNIELPASQGHDVVVLFDTSASQMGPYRAKALETLSAFLAGAKPTTQVKLFAVDLEAHALTDKFVAANSAEMAKGLESLKRRAPLGATDLVAALAAAADSYSAKSPRERSVVYIGDGISSAHFIASDDLKQIVKRLVDGHIAVTSFGIGPRSDSQMLAAIANQTGGVLAVDGEDLTVKQVAHFLASSAQGSVIWPTSATLPKQLADFYPRHFPPLRTDRDTVVVGTLASAVDPKADAQKSIDIAVAGKACGQDVKLNWTVALTGTNEDFSFLPALIDTTKGNDGIGLATVGTAGLLEARRVLNVGVEEIAKLASQAASSGNVAAAEQLSAEALRRDPNDPTARVVKKTLDKQRETEKIAAAAKAAKTPKPVAATKTVSESPTAVSIKPTSKGILKIEKFRNNQAPAPESFGDQPQSPDAPGGFLGDIEQQNHIMSELIKTEVNNELKDARNRMAGDPDGVQQNLKLTLDRVLRAPELTAEDRAELRDELESALREANHQATVKIEIDQTVQANLAAAKETQRIVQSLERKQEKIKQLMDRYEALMDEGRYLLAEDTAAEVSSIEPRLPMAVNAVLTARQTRYQQEYMELRVLRQKGVVDTLYRVELAHIPFPDDEPIIYPSAPVWEELTQRRKKYAAVDLKKVGTAEEKITKALEETTSMEFVETPLSDVIEYLKDLHKIEIQLDTKALEDAGAGSDTPITRNLKGISLKSALRLMLGGLDLTYVIKDEVLLITTPEKAGSELVTKVYPVADLVLPIRQSGFSGGFGGMGGGSGGIGGMNGGGMGGMGNFGGGGGMGGGGMGGGMMGGGMGGGGGGGFFSVPDNAPAASQGLQAFAVKDDVKIKSAPDSVPAPTTAAAEKLKPAPKPTAIELNVPANADLSAAWFDYFKAHEDVADASVRETARQLMKARKFAATIAMIQGALATGHAQPWMYEALGIAMIAGGSDKSEIERALMSAVDFADSTEDLMYAAQYMARNGLEKRALNVFRQVSQAEPLRPEPLLFGLQLASRINDFDGLKWASLGVLKQAWPNNQRAIREQAVRVANGLVEQLKAAKRIKEATEFEAQLSQSLVRDALVRVTWTGDADVDVMIEEPAGTVCSFRNPRTTAGGVMLGDTAARGGGNSKDGYSEEYVCPEAFSGTYKVVLRRVWGKVTAGKVTVEVFTHYGTKQQRYEKQQIPLGEQDSAVVFDVDKGRRNEPLQQHLVANAAAEQMVVNRAVLAQQLGGVSNNAAGFNYALSRAGLNGNFPLVRGAVGFQPVIITLPAGANMTATGVISADRRYVRITCLPLFSQIGQVTTFNIASGNTQTSSGPGQGGGGVGSGIGNPFPPGGGAGGGGAGGGARNPPANPNPGGNNPAGNPM